MQIYTTVYTHKLTNSYDVNKAIYYVLKIHTLYTDQPSVEVEIHGQSRNIVSWESY